MRTVERLGKGVAVLAAVAILAAPTLDRGVAVVGGTSEQRAMARWAVGRFNADGFVLPPLEIRFHEDREGCRGILAYYSDGVADMCRRNTDLMAARSLLHEIAHGWVEANVTGSERERFLQVRGLSTWNDRSVDWDARGFEHAAEIIAWAIGDQSEGTLAPSLPRNSRDELADAYETLTGGPLPRIEAWMTWQASERAPF
jgi:hypothetical protein